MYVVRNQQYFWSGFSWENPDPEKPKYGPLKTKNKWKVSWFEKLNVLLWRAGGFSRAHSHKGPSPQRRGLRRGWEHRVTLFPSFLLSRGSDSDGEMSSLDVHLRGISEKMLYLWPILYYMLWFFLSLNFESLEQLMGARNWVGIGLSYRRARLHRLGRNRFLVIDSGASKKFKNTVLKSGSMNAVHKHRKKAAFFTLGYKRLF